MSEAGPGSVGKGLLFTFLLHFLQVAIVPVVIFVAANVVPSKNDTYRLTGIVVALGGFGVTQLVYMVPVALMLKKRGESRTVQGLIIGASVTFLICAACDGSLFLPGLIRR